MKAPVVRAHPVEPELRDEAITVIGEHFAAGRLEEDEHQRRLDLVVRARGRADLRAVFADLPQPHPDTGEAALRVHRSVFGILAVCLLLFATPAVAVIGFSTGLWWPLVATTAAFILGFSIDARLATRAIREHNRRRKPAPTAESGWIRLSTADRELAVPELGHHLDVGHLELTDFEDRMACLPGLVTRADLDRLFADLPPPHPDLTHVVPPKVAEEGNLRSSVASTIGFTEAIGFACLVVGIPAAIVMWVRTGQWYWLPAAFVGMLAALGSGDQPRSGVADRSGNAESRSPSGEAP